MMRVQNAVIIHGPGRSGTTLLSNMLSLHPDLSWVSGYVNRYPSLPVLAVFNRVQSIRSIERFSRGRRRWPRPTEAYKFWDNYFPMFSAPDARARAEQVEGMNDQVGECIEAIRKVMRYGGGKRFITKITGMPRDRELGKCFEDPFVIYINRDPRAVVMSYYKQRWGYKSNPATFDQKPFGELIEEYANRLRKSWYGRERLKRFRFVDVRYEQLTEDRFAFLDEVLDFVGLPWTSSFRDYIASWTIRSDTNDAWREKLNEDGAMLVERKLGGLMEEMGYIHTSM